MMLNLKYFYEKTYTQYEEYYKIWHENIDRMVFLNHILPLSKQMSCIL